MIVLTDHFKDRWVERVGGLEEQKIIKQIRRLLLSGRFRRHRRPELGVLVGPVHQKFFIIGTLSGRLFIARTVMSDVEATALGWNRSGPLRVSLAEVLNAKRTL